MRRLLYIGHPHATPEKEDWYKALQKKYECTFYCPDNGREYFHSFDIIYIHAGSIAYERCLQIKAQFPNAKTVQWTGDCRDNLMPDVLRLKGLVDITLLACGMGKQKEMYEKEMGRVEWFPHGVSDWQFKEINPNAKGIVFIGNNYGLFSGDIARAEICKQLKQDYGDEFKVYGNGWGDIGEGTVPFEENHIIYNNALIGIDGSIFNDKDGYFSHRPLQIMAAGCYCPVKVFPQVRLCFPLHWTWDTYSDLKTLINEARNPDRRSFLVKQQQEFVRNNYHWDVLVERFDKIIYG